MKQNLSNALRARQPKFDTDDKADRSALSALFIPLVIALLCAIGVLLLLLAAGDFFCVFLSAVTNPTLYIPAILTALSVFVFLKLRSRKFLSIACCILSLLLFTGYFVSLIRHPLPLLQLITQRDRAAALSSQQTKPVFENAVRYESASPALYFEQSDTQQMPSQEQKEALATMLASLPDALQKNAAGVYFLSEKSFNDAIASQSTFDAAGFSSSSDFSVAIKVPDLDLDEYWTYFRDGTRVSLNSPQSYLETLVHELTHLADLQMDGQTLRLSSTPEWKAIYETQKDVFGPYGATSPIELFAEGGVYYFLYSDLLHELSPAIEDFFADHFPEGANTSSAA